MQLPPQSSINATCDAYHRVTVALCEQARATLPCRIDVRYGDHPEQALDIYLPARASARGHPIFLNIHGGGWTHGHKEWAALGAPAVTALPAIYVSLGYRLAPAAKYPAQLEDCLGALAWLIEHASGFGGDPTRIHIGGHSAGGHIAAMAALCTDRQQAWGLPPGSIRSCFGLSGLYDLRGAHQAPAIPGLSAVPLLPDEEWEAAASPVLAAIRVPTFFYLSWGTQEGEAFHAGGAAFAAALRAAGNQVETELPDLDHFWIHLDQLRSESSWNRALRRRLIGAGDETEARV